MPRPTPSPAPRPSGPTPRPSSPPSQPKAPTGPRPAPRHGMAAALTLIASGVACLAVGFTSETDRWSMPTDQAADYALVPLVLVFLFVSLVSSPTQRHRAHPPLRASGTAPFEGCGPVPSSSPDGRASSAALAG